MNMLMIMLLLAPLNHEHADDHHPQPAPHHL
jgi:hypothetical protein